VAGTGEKSPPPPTPVETRQVFGQTLNRFEGPFGERWTCDCGWEPSKFSGYRPCWHIMTQILNPRFWPPDVMEAAEQFRKEHLGAD